MGFVRHFAVRLGQKMPERERYQMRPSIVSQGAAISSKGIRDILILAGFHASGTSPLSQSALKSRPAISEWLHLRTVTKHRRNWGILERSD